MERTLAWIRDNPQFAAVSFAVAVLALIMTVLAITMTRAGVSLRPIVWFLGFFAIVAGPQAVVHLLDGLVLRRGRQELSKDMAPSPPRAMRNHRTPVDWKVVFGPEADPDLVTDAKPGLAAIVGAAQEAKLSFRRDGSSALAARFDSPAAAERARDVYGKFFAFARVEGSDADGWTARRHGGQGEWVHLITAGPELYAWTNASKEAALANRVRALGPISSSTARSVTSRAADSALVSKRLASQTGLMIGIVSLNLVAAGVWFFKGSAWAARVERSRLALPSSAQMLRGELMALNKGDGGVAVTPQPDGTMEISWRYADARWFDLMRLHQMKRVHRLVLTFDEPQQIVRVREYWSAFDASASPRDLRLNWTAATGIQFFMLEHKRVFGAQLGADGLPTGELSKAYTFDLQALKRPVIEAVTRAGWDWQPVVWSVRSSTRSRS